MTLEQIFKNYKKNYSNHYSLIDTLYAGKDSIYQRWTAHVNKLYSERNKRTVYKTYLDDLKNSLVNNQRY